MSANSNRRQQRAARRAIPAVFSVRRMRRTVALTTRIGLLVVGATLIATGAAVTLWTGLGAGPMDVLISAINTRTGLAVPFVVWIVAGTLMSVATLVGRRPGLGTFLAPLIVGPVLGIIRSVLATVPPPSQHGGGRLAPGRRGDDRARRRITDRRRPRHGYRRAPRRSDCPAHRLGVSRTSGPCSR